jgi:scyllo-inositol 2-dehydrogenase (NADP+)
MNIATIGTGFIVDYFLQALNDIEGMQCVAIYSRKRETAMMMSTKYNIEFMFTDLDEMLSKSDVDFVYVASPNSLHYEHAYRALNHGKHVICEKPFTSTVEETESLIRLAKEKNLMLFEGITTIHLPNYKIIKEQLVELGDIKFIQCNYSQLSSRYQKLLSGETPNVFNPDFSGGALADINIYNLHFVMNLFGIPENVLYTANIHPNGIDTSGIAVMKYPHFIAECVGCKDTRSMNFVLIQGEKGYIHVENGPNGCQSIILNVLDKEIALNNQSQSNLLYYELVTFHQIYKSNDLKRCYELIDYTHSVMEVYEKLRESGGIVFKADK